MSVSAVIDSMGGTLNGSNGGAAVLSPVVGNIPLS
jgi:hypothetical protein